MAGPYLVGVDCGTQSAKVTIYDAAGNALAEGRRALRPTSRPRHGVVVHPDHWGRGVALEAGLAAARDLFERVGLDRVYAGVDPGNIKSLRALAKAPRVRKVDDELYELRADAFGAGDRADTTPA